MIKSSFGDRLDGWIRTLFPFLFTRSLNPDWLTLCGVVISLAAATAFGLGAFLAGGLLLLASGFFDLVDGVVARHQGTSTPFGAFLDATMDRFVDMVVLFGLIVHYGRVDATAMVLVTGVVLVMSVMTSYAKAKADQLVGSLEGGLLERGERVGLLAAGAILGFMEPVLVLLAVGTTATVAQRFVLARRALDELKRLTPAEAGDPAAPAAPAPRVEEGE